MIDFGERFHTGVGNVYAIFFVLIHLIVARPKR